MRVGSRRCGSTTTPSWTPTSRSRRWPRTGRSAWTCGAVPGGGAHPAAGGLRPHRAGLRHRRGRRHAVLRDDVRRPGVARPPAGAGRAAAVPRVVDLVSQAGPAWRCCTSTGWCTATSSRRTSCCAAAAAPATGCWSPTSAWPRRCCTPPGSPRSWHPGVHGARAGHRRRHRRARRRPRPGRGDLPDAHRPAGPRGQHPRARPRARCPSRRPGSTPSLPPEVDEVLLRSLDPSPEARYADIESFVDALRAALPVTVTAVRRRSRRATRPPTRVRPRCRPRRRRGHRRPRCCSR